MPPIRNDPVSPLECTTRVLDGAVCLSVSGELDLAGVPAFLGHLNRALEKSTNIIVEASGLRYIDSSGINTLLMAQQSFARDGHRIVLAAISPMMRRVLTIISVEASLPVYPTTEAALASFRTRGASG